MGKINSIKRPLQEIGSPNWSVSRTFQSVFPRIRQIRKQSQTANKKDRVYRNPVILAQEWRNLLLHGGYKSFSELAAHLRVSRARITQVTRLLRLSPKVLEVIVALGDPLPLPVVTERMLRPLVNMPYAEQEKMMRYVVQG